LVGRIGSDSPPAGGVGLRPLTETSAEVKRLWVDPARRGQGVGLALMDALEAAARDLGYATLRLETGPKQPEAIALYAGSGWTRRDGPDDEFRFFKELR
jgi:GNAT superfamily N-acetyltransferase